MRFSYKKFDGSLFPTQDSLSEFSHFMDIVMEYGDQVLDAMKNLEEDPDQKKIIDKWIEDGLLEKMGTRFRLTPHAIKSMQKNALMEIFRNMKSGAGDGHESTATGKGYERLDGTKSYQYGDPVSEIDMQATMKNALKRNGPGLPFSLSEQDFETYLHETKTSCSTVILLDMSGSMNRWDRFPNAKRCAMAMHALIQQQFVSDTVDVVGFYSGAEIIQEHKIPLLMPKRVTIFDPVVDLTIPISRISEAPPHFTNLQMGLMLARKILQRRSGENKQVFIITDGQPTAHVSGEYVHLQYPPTEETTITTLSTAITMAKQGIRFATFAIIDDYAYMDWVGFVDHISKITKGIAFYCTSSQLSECVMESYLSGRKKKSFIM